MCCSGIPAVRSLTFTTNYRAIQSYAMCLYGTSKELCTRLTAMPVPLVKPAFAWLPRAREPPTRSRA